MFRSSRWEISGQGGSFLWRSKVISRDMNVSFATKANEISASRFGSEARNRERLIDTRDEVRPPLAAALRPTSATVCGSQRQSTSRGTAKVGRSFETVSMWEADHPLLWEG